MAENALQYLICGWPLVSDIPAETPDILAITPDLSDAEATALQQAANLAPMPVDGILESQAIALMTLNNNKPVGDKDRLCVLARAHFQKRDQSLPAYQYVRVPGTLLDKLGGDIQPLLNLLAQPIPTYTTTHAEIAPLKTPGPPTWSLEKDAAMLKSVLDESAGGDMLRLLQVLGAALDGGAVLSHFAMDWRERIALVRGLMLLLPTLARPHLTFSTHVMTINGRMPRLVFSEAQAAAPRLIDWSHPEPQAHLLEQPYIAHLVSLWDSDVLALLTIIHDMDILAAAIMPGQMLVDGLNAVVERHQVDLAMMRGEPVAADIAINILSSDAPPMGDMRLRYIKYLFRLALEQRDTAAALVVARAMDSDTQLDSHLQTLFDADLETQPDAAYVFARTRLSEGIDPRWLQRLRAAAEKSLAVAVESGDADTLSSWLNLISREPTRYELSDVLQTGILAARKRAPDSPKLAQDLLILAVKRQPDILPTLLQDPDVIGGLPGPLLAALVDFDSDAIEHLAAESRELFLLTLNRAIDEERNCITANAVRSLWEIHTQQQTNNLPPQFRPAQIIRHLAETGIGLTEGAAETLLTLILASGTEDTLFFSIAPELALHGELPDVLVSALEHSGREPGDLLDIVNHLTTHHWLEAQDTANTYAVLLADQNWDESSLPLVEQLARVLNQHPETEVPRDALWKIAELSGEMKSESMLRVATRRLLGAISELTLESEIIENVQRLRKAINWSPAGRSVLLRWWREYMHTQNLVQLQKLEKALEGKRSLDDLRAVVQTAIALRRVIGQHSMTEFAEAIHTTYTVLQALSEGFDPEGKAPLAVDSATLRSELDALADELPADSRQVLATNLKELAQIVTTLAEHRSKPSLIRSDEAIERQLLTGEQQPQSALDVMRWLSGYLVGVQREDDGE